MNQKKAKKLRQLVTHLMGSGQVDEQRWVNYGREQKFVEMEVPDMNAPTVFDDEGKLIVTTRKQLVATGSRMLDPGCGRAIYKNMKKQ